MAHYFYIDGNGSQHGPCTVDDLRASGAIAPTTPVWSEGMADWTQAGHVQELETLFSGSVGPTPPPVSPANAAFGQQPGQEAAQPGRPAAETRQPVYRHKPDSWLAWSIIATIMCCPLLGIPAIVYASKVDSLWNDGRYDEAEAAARTARTWTIVAACSGLLVSIVYAILLSLGMLSGFVGAMSL